jgi:YbbR domain-containing protein
MKKLLDFAKRILLENWGLKLAGIFLAYLLWLLVSVGASERDFTVPLIVQIPHNMEIVNDRPNSITATALVDSRMLDKLPDLSYTIDLHAKGEGEHVITLSPGAIQVGADSGITMIRVAPSRIVLVLEGVIMKETPIKVPIQGNPAAGFQVEGIICRPDIVHIYGPRSKINPIAEVETDPVTVSGRKRSFQTTVNFSLQHVDIHTSPAAVEVTVNIGAPSADKAGKM